MSVSVYMERQICWVTLESKSYYNHPSHGACFLAICPSLSLSSSVQVVAWEFISALGINIPVTRKRSIFEKSSSRGGTSSSRNKRRQGKRRRKHKIHPLIIPFILFRNNWRGVQLSNPLSANGDKNQRKLVAMDSSQLSPMITQRSEDEGAKDKSQPHLISSKK